MRLVDHLLEGEAMTAQCGQLLDAVAEVLAPVLRDLDPGPIAPAVVPAEPDAMAEERGTPRVSAVTRVFSGESVSLRSSARERGEVLLLVPGLFFGPEDEHHEIVRVSDGQEHRASRLAFVVAELADGIAGAGIGPCRPWSGAARRSVRNAPRWPTSVMLAKSGESTPPCGVPALVRTSAPSDEDARPSGRPDQPAHLQVRTRRRRRAHDMVVVDVVEAALDVPFDDPLIGRTGPVGRGLLPDRADRVADVLQSVATRLPRTEAVRDGQEVRLEDWLQQLQQRSLNDPILTVGTPRGGTCPACHAWGSSRAAPGSAGSCHCGAAA